MDKAKALVEESGTAGHGGRRSSPRTTRSQAIGHYLQSLLTELGYEGDVKPISSNIQFTYIQNTNNKVQISVSQWYQDYPAASDFLNVLLSCASFHPGQRLVDQHRGLLRQGHRRADAGGAGPRRDRPRRRPTPSGPPSTSDDV